MKKKYLIVLVLAILLPFIFQSCNPLPDPPSADFSASIINTSGDVSISFSDLSSNSPDQWDWYFEGGSPSSSTEENPTVTYSSSGTYEVTLTVKNDGGEDIITVYDYISIGEFNNPTWTDMEMTVGDITKSIPVDGYELFARINNTSMSYYAETYGSTYTGTQIGLLIYWENTVDLSEYSAWNLNVSSDFVFINITNYGTDDLYPLYVNYGTNQESVDYITIANDGYKKSTGYFDAYDYMEIRAKFASNQSSSVYWQEGYEFNLPWLSNQGLDLSNSYKKNEIGESSATNKDVKNQKAKSIIQSGIRK